MSDIEKPEAVVEPSMKEEAGPFDPDAGISEVERAKIERKLLWRIDLYLMPWLCFLYLISYLDRTNIGNAKIAHLTEDIHMSSNGYFLTLTIFFISYALFEPLANFLLKFTKPSIFIPCIMLCWGSCMLGMGFVHNWEGLMAARWFLGLTEAGLFPGVNFYLSCWYKRNELGIRAAIFFSAAAMAGSFGGLLAAAIQKMDGIQGIAGWAWIFIIEGMLTIIVGIISFWMVHDFPHEAKFLSNDDRARVLNRLSRDNQALDQNTPFKMDFFWAAVKDWKLYVGAMMYMGILMPSYSFALFLPTIIQQMRFTNPHDIIRNQLLSVPPYIGGALNTILIGFWSDRIQKRGVFNFAVSTCGIVGFAMIVGSDQAGVQYAGTFVAALGIYPAVALTTTWIANNVEGVYKRGILMGMVIGWGNLNGVVSSNVYRDPPRFYAGHGVVIGYLTFGLLGGSILFYTLMRRENKARMAGERDHLIEGKTQEEIAELLDGRPDYMYTL
ncbi:major facilitator superfamily protein [Sarocladium implicatum]|nr:major facilitator superfamily protein [Sarocladium implicatum]